MITFTVFFVLLWSIFNRSVFNSLNSGESPKEIHFHPVREHSAQRSEECALSERRRERERERELKERFLLRSLPSRACQTQARTPLEISYFSPSLFSPQASSTCHPGVWFSNSLNFLFSSFEALRSSLWLSTSLAANRWCALNLMFAIKIALQHCY